MAQVLNGSLNTSAYSGRYLTLSWWGAQSISGNYTDIHWTILGAGGDPDKWYEAGNFKAVIAGETVYSSSARIQLRKDATVASGIKRVTHNSNGSKSFSASLEAGIYYVAVNCAGSGSWDLKDIPRGATITSAPDFTDEQSPTISYSNPAGASVDALEICITLDGSNADVVYRSVAKTGSSYTFSLTDAERKVLRAATVGATTRKVGFYLKTTIGSNEFYSKVWKTLTIVNCAPTLSPTIKDTGAVSSQLTGDPTGKIISGYNNITLSTGAAAKKEATIVSQSITIGGQTISAASGSFENIALSSGIVEYRVTDSRNLTTVIKKEVTVIPYFKPTITLKKNNVSTSGEFLLEVSGRYFSGSFGTKDNPMVVEFKWKDSGGSWSDWQALSPTITGNDFAASVKVTGLDYKKSYVVQARVRDMMVAIPTEEYAVVSIPVFDWGKDGINFNVPVYVQGEDLNSYLERGMMYRGTVSGDFNNYKSTGLYVYGGTSDSNRPVETFGATYGILRVQDAVYYITQELIAYNGTYNRRCIEGVWEDWRFEPAFNATSTTDFVKEQGVTNGWYWRKWYSGKAECWKTITINVAITKAWGSMYVGSANMARQTYPFTFNTKPKEIAGITTSSNAVWLFSESGGNGINTTTASAIYNICRPSQITAAANYDINLYVLGTLA